MLNNITVPSSRQLKGWTILWIALIAGTLDITDALVFSSFRGVTPRRVFQRIASGLIGAGSTRLGLTSVLLGVVLHYAIATIWTIIFYVASRRLTVLLRRPVISGLLFGTFVYIVMNFVVLPLSALPPARQPVTLASRINGVLALMFCIGLTVSLLLNWRLRRNNDA